MNRQTALETQGTARETPSEGVLRRKCDCGQHTSCGDCQDCRKRQTLERRFTGYAASASSPPIVHEVLRSPGLPLDPATKGFMERGLGGDFSRVRVHTDGRAAESARAVEALAYTAGEDIVFGDRQYQPGTLAGKRLLAHELTHVVQQSRGTSVGPAEADAEREAETASVDLFSGVVKPIKGRESHRGIQRQPKQGEVQGQDSKKVTADSLDEKAKKIIAIGTDPKKTIDQRAIEAVKAIVNEYYEQSMVEEVVYEEADPGLTTTYVGKGNQIKGKIAVGKYFIETLEKFYARKVLQAGHEVQHIKQQREGLGGGANKNKREFLAFSWESLEPEAAGTGKVPHATRRALIDSALKNYYCLGEEDQKQYATKKEELLKRRAVEEKASGQSPTTPPASCTS